MEQYISVAEVNRGEKSFTILNKTNLYISGKIWEETKPISPPSPPNQLSKHTPKEIQNWFDILIQQTFT